MTPKIHQISPVTTEIPSFTDTSALPAITEFPSSPPPPSTITTSLEPPPTPMDSRLRRRLRRELARKIDAKEETREEDSALGTSGIDETVKARKKTVTPKPSLLVPHSVPPPLSTSHSHSTPSNILSDNPLDWLFWDPDQSPSTLDSSPPSEPIADSTLSCPTPLEGQDTPPSPESPKDSPMIDNEP